MRSSLIDRLKKLRPAPGDLRIVQDFINTADLDAGTDELSSPEALASWLASQVLLPAGTELRPVDVVRASEFRESLRKLLVAGESATPEINALVDQTMAEASSRPRVTAGGWIRFEPVVEGIDGAIGRIVSHLAVGQRQGYWPRFKACASDACQAAFYDYSTNRSTLWCLPRCGGRIRAREFRNRKKR